MTAVSYTHLSMTACSSKPAETAAPETQAETTADTTAEAVEEAKTEAAEAVEGKDPAEVKVGISIYQFADNFMTVYRQELERYLTCLLYTSRCV